MLCAGHSCNPVESLAPERPKFRPAGEWACMSMDRVVPHVPSALCVQWNSCDSSGRMHSVSRKRHMWALQEVHSASSAHQPDSSAQLSSGQCSRWHDSAQPLPAPHKTVGSFESRKLHTCYMQLMHMSCCCGVYGAYQHAHDPGGPHTSGKALSPTSSEPSHSPPTHASRQHDTSTDLPETSPAEEQLS